MSLELHKCSQSPFFAASIEDIDPDVAMALKGELDRQSNQIELIASENIVSRAVLEAAGSVFTNKYAEGYPNKRYYGGCRFADIVEQLAIDRATELFNCDFANVQTHSGSQANQAAFMSLMEPGDTFLGLALNAGGHLTHGAKPNQSGKWFNAVQYGVRPEDAQIDLDEKRYAKASMQLTARDRMREIKLWSHYKKKYDDGSFDTKNVNTHQLHSYHLTMKNKAETLTQGSSQPEVFNVLGQLQSIERIKKDILIENKKKEDAKLEFDKNSIGQQD